MSLEHLIVPKTKQVEEGGAEGETHRNGAMSKEHGSQLQELLIAKVGTI